MFKVCWRPPVLDTVIFNTLSSMPELEHAFTALTGEIAQRNVQDVI